MSVGKQVDYVEAFNNNVWTVLFVVLTSYIFQSLYYDKALFDYYKYVIICVNINFSLQATIMSNVCPGV